MVLDYVAAEGVELPLPPAGTTTPGTRREAGEAKQVAYFGDRMRGAWNKGGINKLLAENCFGDWYTRAGLSDRERELVTFCVLASIGGAEPQFKSHAAANINLGNGKGLLTEVLLAICHCTGYPRTLNALAALGQV